MDDLPVIRSSKFSEYPSVILGCSTRTGGVSPEPYGLNLSFHVGDDHARVLENRQRFFRRLGIALDQLAIPEQCHSNTVRRVFRPGSYEKCDALVTDQGAVFLTMSVADCIPLFMYDPQKDVVAAVHVGWRGCASGIVTETIRLLAREFAVQPEHLLVYMGPSARACCYEVGDDVANDFPARFLQRKSAAKFFLDLPGVSKSQLIENGVREDRIEENGTCTICTPELFHSYRRDGARSGRMIGVIGLVQ